MLRKVLHPLAPRVGAVEVEDHRAAPRHRAPHPHRLGDEFGGEFGSEFDGVVVRILLARRRVGERFRALGGVYAREALVAEVAGVSAPAREALRDVGPIRAAALELDNQGILLGQPLDLIALLPAVASRARNDHYRFR